MPPAEFEPAIPASKRQQTHALYSAATGDIKKADKIYGMCCERSIEKTISDTEALAL
jgi:hypothetical protein